MKRHLTAIGAAVLVLCLLLSACGGTQESGGEPVQAANAAAYTSEQLSLELPIAELTASGAGNGCLYLAGREEEEIEPAEPEGEEEFTSGFTFSTTTSDDGEFAFYSGGISRASLYRLDIATGVVAKLDGYVPGEGMTVAAIVPWSDSNSTLS